MFSFATCVRMESKHHKCCRTYMASVLVWSRNYFQVDLLAEHLVCVFLFVCINLRLNKSTFSLGRNSLCLLAAAVCIWSSEAMNHKQLLPSFILHHHIFTILLLQWPGTSSSSSSPSPSTIINIIIITSPREIYINTISLSILKIKHNLIAYSNDSIKARAHLSPRYRSDVINNAIHYLAQMQRLLIKGLWI